MNNNILFTIKGQFYNYFIYKRTKFDNNLITINIDDGISYPSPFWIRNGKIDWPECEKDFPPLDIRNKIDRYLQLKVFL